MICADFLADANLDHGRSGDDAFLDDQILQAPARRAQAGIPRRLERGGVMSSIGPKPVRLRLDPLAYESSGSRCYDAMAGAVNRVAQ